MTLVDRTLEMAQLTLKGILFWRIVLESGKHAPSFSVIGFPYIAQI